MVILLCITGMVLKSILLYQSFWLYAVLVIRFEYYAFVDLQMALAF